MDNQHPPAVVEAIIELAARGLTRSAIAAKIGNISRSAVSGILYRHGIFTPAPRKPPRDVRPKRIYIKAKASQPYRVRSPDFTLCETAHGGVTWRDLEPSRCCTWPVQGDLWCGETKQSGTSYCATHFRMAYRKAS